MKLQLKLITLCFRTKLTQKGYLRSRKEKKIKITIKFYICSNQSRFQISASTNNFELLKQFSQTRILQKQKKQKKLTSPLNCLYSN